jgi:segregation and condensation protein B
VSDVPDGRSLEVLEAALKENFDKADAGAPAEEPDTSHVEVPIHDPGMMEVAGQVNNKDTNDESY